MTGEARLWRSWNTMRSRYATATPALIPEYDRGGAGAQPGRLLKFHAPEIVFGIDSMAEAAHAAVRLGALRALLVPDPRLIEAGWVDEMLGHLRAQCVDAQTVERPDAEPQGPRDRRRVYARYSNQDDLVVEGEASRSGRPRRWCGRCTPMLRCWT